MPEPQPPDPKPGDIPCVPCGWPMRWSRRGGVLICPRCDTPDPTDAPPGPPTTGRPSL